MLISSFKGAEDKKGGQNDLIIVKSLAYWWQIFSHPDFLVGLSSFQIGRETVQLKAL